jgi:hypothetical protein
MLVSWSTTPYAATESVKATYKLIIWQPMLILIKKWIHRLKKSEYIPYYWEKSIKWWTLFQTFVLQRFLGNWVLTPYKFQPQVLSSGQPQEKPWPIQSPQFFLFCGWHFTPIGLMDSSQNFDLDADESTSKNIQSQRTEVVII